MTNANQYGFIRSIRHHSKGTMNLINAICSKFGDRIIWEERGAYNIIDRVGQYAIYFRRRGNKYANWLELLSVDVAVLREIKEVFPKDFLGEVEIKEGVL